MRMRMISSGLAAMLLASCATVETGPPLADGAMLPSGEAAVLRMPATEPAPEEPADDSLGACLPSFSAPSGSTGKPYKVVGFVVTTSTRLDVTMSMFKSRG